MKRNLGETRHTTDALIIATLATTAAWLIKLGNQLRASR